MYDLEYDDEDGLWHVVSPDGEDLATFCDEEDARPLLSHLNRWS